MELKKLILTATETYRQAQEFEHSYRDKVKGTIYLKRTISYNNHLTYLLNQIKGIRYGTINLWSGQLLPSRETFTIFLPGELEELEVKELLWITDKVRVEQLNIIQNISLGIIRNS